MVVHPHDALNRSWVNVGPPSVTLAHIQRGTIHETVNQYRANVGSALKTVGQHQPSIESTSRVCWGGLRLHNGNCWTDGKDSALSGQR